MRKKIQLIFMVLTIFFMLVSCGAEDEAVDVLAAAQEFVEALPASELVARIRMQVQHVHAAAGQPRADVARLSRDETRQQFFEAQEVHLAFGVVDLQRRTGCHGGVAALRRLAGMSGEAHGAKVYRQLPQAHDGAAKFDGTNPARLAACIDRTY